MTLLTNTTTVYRIKCDAVNGACQIMTEPSPTEGLARRIASGEGFMREVGSGSRHFCAEHRASAAESGIVLKDPAKESTL